MGINYSIDARARIVRLEYVHATNIDELMATMRAIFRSPSYRPGFGFIVDRRNIDAPTREFVERLIAFMKLQREALAGARWAVVAPSAAGYGMSGQVPIRVFMEIDEAERWLRETAAPQP